VAGIGEEQCWRLAMVVGSDFKELWGSGEPPATRMAGRRAARPERPPSGLRWPLLVFTAANRAAALELCASTGGGGARLQGRARAAA
jgi:hypothetical protein